MCAAQVIVIAIDAGHDCMFQTERGDGFGNPPWFIPIKRSWFAFGHRTKTASPRADIAQQHECGGPMIPAFPDIGTLRRLAYRV